MKLIANMQARRKRTATSHINIAVADTRLRGRTVNSAMALARPLRLLLAVCVVLAFFLIYQAAQSPSPLSLTKDKYYNGLKRDPLLDST